MIKAILYTTKTGTTEWYAKRLGEELKLPVLQLKEGEKELRQGTEIIYRKTAVKLPHFKVEDARLKNKCLNCYKSL